ncbi:MAG TPA: GAF domain-containing protein, partial [Marmoricola sp.]|nr:GAF domain-containing protein [Marmoricola sp.]
MSPPLAPDPDDASATEVRLRLLQSLVHRLVDVRETEQMAEAVVCTAVGQPGVVSARVFLLDDEVLRSIASSGVPSAADAFSEIALDADLPAAEVVRSGLPVHAVDLAALYARYPSFGEVAPYPHEHSLHIVPLRIEGVVTGLLTLTFVSDALADDAQRQFVTAIADTLAQAIERGRVTRRVEAERERELALLTAQADALAAVVSGEPLVSVLDELLRTVERASSEGVLASVLLLDDDA